MDGLVDRSIDGWIYRIDTHCKPAVHFEALSLLDAFE